MPDVFNRMNGSNNGLDTVLTRGGLKGLLVKSKVRRGLRVEYKSGAGDLGHDLLEHFNPLAAQRRLDIDESGDVPTGPRQARDKPAADRIGHADEHDRYRGGLVL